MGLILRLLILCSALGLSPSSVAQLPIRPFSADYLVYFHGLPLGRGTIRLHDEGARHYRMEAEVSGRGLAALLSTTTVRESVQGYFGVNTLYPLHYRRRQAGRRHDTKLTFDWPAASVIAYYKNRRTILPLAPRTTDPLSLTLLLMVDLKTGYSADQYTLIHKSALRSYRVGPSVRERIETPLGEFVTIRLQHRRRDKNRITTFWFAPELDFLPVQISHRRDGFEVFAMKIHKLDH